MALTRRGGRPWDPFREMQDMMERFNRGFGQGALAPTDDHLKGFDWAPTVNIAESSKAYVIKAELPEVDKKDVHVDVENGVLKISGERRYEKEEEDEKYHRVESAYGSFMRSFAIPEDAEPEGIEASFKNGMLKVRIPKLKEPPSKSKRISVS